MKNVLRFLYLVLEIHDTVFYVFLLVGKSDISCLRSMF